LTLHEPREPFDLESYKQRVGTGTCFICELASAPDSAGHHIVYRDEKCIAFLNKYPTLRGYTLVAPVEHLEQVTGDFSPEDYQRLQRVVYEIAQALRAELPVERMYILSLGSQQGNSHVHWHIAPLPPGVPYDEQQLDAIDMRQGVLRVTDAEMAEIAARLRDRVAGRLAAR